MPTSFSEQRRRFGITRRPSTEGRLPDAASSSSQVRELDPRAAVRLAGAPSRRGRSPPSPRRGRARRRARRAASARSRSSVSRRACPPRASSSSCSHRLGRVLLVRPDDPRRPALDPAGAVRRHRAPTRPPSFGIVPVRSSNGTPGQRDAVVADAAKDEPALDRLVVVGRARRVRAVDELVADELDRPRRARRRGSRRASAGSAARIARGLPVGLARGVLAQDARRSASRSPAQPRARPRSARRARARRDRPGCPRRRGRRARRPRPASTPPAPARAVRRRRSRGCPTSLIASIASSVVSVGASSSGRQREHPGDVERDVAVADHDRSLVREVELEVLEVRVAVVPGDELAWPPTSRAGPRRGSRAGGRSARRPRRRPRRRAARSSSCVHVDAELDVAEEAEAGLLRGPLERARDRLQLRVVGRDAEPDETPRRRQPLDHVDLGGRVGARAARSAA